MLFADTSALIKLYVSEAGSDTMSQLAADTLAVSALAWPEAMATFGRRFREGLDDTPRHRQRVRQLEQDWPSYLRVALSEPVLARVADLCARHPLRAGDAIQLASALLLRDAGASVRFAGCDQRLNQAAAAEGLEVLSPMEPPRPAV